MRLAVLAVGRLKAGPERELLSRYVERSAVIGRTLGVPAVELHEIDESRARRAEDRRADEHRLLTAKCPASSAMAVLDERGRDLTSEDFARLLGRHRDEGRNLAFLIGGADGIDPALLSRADHWLRFGAMTLPHQLVRVLLAEQIYRATTILAGHPYHRGADHRD